MFCKCGRTVNGFVPTKFSWCQDWAKMLNVLGLLGPPKRMGKHMFLLVASFCDNLGALVIP